MIDRPAHFANAQNLPLCGGEGRVTHNRNVQPWTCRACVKTRRVNARKRAEADAERLKPKPITRPRKREVEPLPTGFYTQFLKGKQS